ncbi:MarR family winged helix-turn-helix transcriptional regulator [Aliirhizobium smilacinae]|uniref:Winged helix-turn-helix transcriptional regulator n=1 Tax=Aliirhizobium smilacinae TaxID=1395944 RepID=A0A5C4XBI4_9HYPH|nr:MarR family winged helix-turn-helix transcriptional regulator [Rhizobium smilacinae]TNM60846.1 winged helix-turn-helix transcriptional regulator [Rhizobium smilacinae]
MSLPVKISHDESQGDLLGLLIVDTARALRTAFENRINAAGLGLTPGEARALIHIADHEGSRQLDIASQMGVEPMTLCTYLDKLQTLGLIERHKCIADRRAKRIGLTTTSDDMIRRIRAELHVILDHATSGLSHEAKSHLEASLAVLNRNLQEACPPAQPGTDESR